MTAIVAIACEDTVLMGADSLSASSTFGCTELAEPKVFRRGALVMGYAGSSRLAQVVQYEADFGDPPPGTDFTGWLVTVLVPEYRKALKQAGALYVRENVESSDGCLLVAWTNQVRVIDSDFQVRRGAVDYVAIGSGRPYAEGSLYSAEFTDLSSSARITRAIRAAAYHNAGVRGVITLLRTSTTKGD
jgi:ATP-dependent protease HslVU (ClpYQ) peptidase subunit